MIGLPKLAVDRVDRRHRRDRFRSGIDLLLSQSLLSLLDIVVGRDVCVSDHGLLRRLERGQGDEIGSSDGTSRRLQGGLEHIVAQVGPNNAGLEVGEGSREGAGCGRSKHAG